MGIIGKKSVFSENRYQIPNYIALFYDNADGIDSNLLSKLQQTKDIILARSLNEFKQKENILLQEATKQLSKISNNIEQAQMLDFAVQGEDGEIKFSPNNQSVIPSNFNSNAMNFINAITEFRKTILDTGTIYSGLDKLIKEMNNTPSLISYIEDAVVVANDAAQQSKSHVIREAAKKIVHSGKGKQWRKTVSGTIAGMNTIHNVTAQWLVLLSALESVEDGNFSANQKARIEQRIKNLTLRNYSNIVGNLREVVDQIGQLTCAYMGLNASDEIMEAVQKELSIKNSGGSFISTKTTIRKDGKVKAAMDDIMKKIRTEVTADDAYVDVIWPSVQPKVDNQINTFGVRIGGISNKVTSQVKTTSNGVIAKKINVVSNSPLIALLMRDLDIKSDNEIMSLLQIGMGYSFAAGTTESELLEKWNSIKEYVRYAGMVSVLTGMNREVVNNSKDLVTFININDTIVPMNTFLSQVTQSLLTGNINTSVSMTGFPERHEMLERNIYVEPPWYHDRYAAVERSNKAIKSGIGLLYSSKISIALRNISLTSLINSSGFYGI